MGIFGGAGYWIYNTWLDSVSPRRKRTGRAAVTKKDSGLSTEAPSVAAVTGAEKKFDQSWIPEHHIKKTGARAKSPKGDKK